ncbi:hypothetical protein B0O99DRAFT_499004 [Bisporella sp. PMI_857]|nr:hypothetical protein B0O99DRAFT_499004 [Bisporella sp. PMI_857]
MRFPLEEPNPVNNRLDHEGIDAERPFNRWMKHLHKKNKDNQRRMTINGPLNGLENGPSSSPTRLARFRHQKSSSESSSGFVTAIKSASISLASLSIAPPSKRTGVSSHHNRTEISSRTSQIGRRSEDNSFIARSAVVDQGVTARLLQRRHVLEELITTEENYVADVKFLQHAYVNLMGSIPSLTPNLRASINLNLSEIIEMHEGLLRDLHKIIPCSDYVNVNCIEENKPMPPTHGHNRWRSLDAVPEHTSNGTWLQKIPGMTIEPQTAAEVARAFGQRLSRFFVYEEYGAKYEIMLKDVTATYRTMPQWLAFEKGLEALATALASLNTKNNIAKKALTTGDLLVKPLQRVCKYPLLFGELLKQTPVCDCPDSHLAIENVLIRLREATAEINRATDDPHMKIAIEKSWILQDRLLVHAQSETRSKISVRNLGHINLCGVLYVSWQTKDGVEGQYLICLLYRDYLLLASAARPEQVYTIQAWIGRSDMRVEELDNGRGLQCHTALFSWKLVFEIDHQLLELTMSACSPKEETEWRERLAAQPCNSCVDAGEEASMSFLTLDVKSLGTIFGKPGTIARRMSIHRATTIGQMTGLCHVIIKNTTAFKDIGISAASTSINRSQSLLSPKRIPVLAPLRGERIRLEALLADVWSRELLPFPGMVGRARGDVRTSASSIMRKLSVASIASNFTKRSSSMASIHKPTDGELIVNVEAMKPSIMRAEHISSEAASIFDSEDLDRLRLSAIADEKENVQRDPFDYLAATLSRPKG